ncbi:MAG: hypothetical protein JO169_13380 [Solirubrobacterales bacterium]|nr:hypothetical protein [Solirubrobacterales bacterium]
MPWLGGAVRVVVLLAAPEPVELVEPLEPVELAALAIAAPPPARAPVTASVTSSGLSLCFISDHLLGGGDHRIRRERVMSVGAR